MCLDKPALRPLPKRPYEVAEWKHAKVNIDYHVEFDHRLYGLRHALDSRDDGDCRNPPRRTLTDVEIVLVVRGGGMEPWTAPMKFETSRKMFRRR